MRDEASRIDEERLLACARDLIRAPSENPPGDESEAAARAEAWCREAGLAVERIEAAPGRTNVVATLDTGEAGPTLIFNGHLDVVPAMDASLWPHPPYAGVVEDGLLHGRGSCDMKGAIAAAIEAARALRDAPLRGRFVLQLVADEEVFGPLGTLTLRDRGLLTGDAAIVGEPTGLAVGVAQRGLFWTRVTTRGVAAHGSVPDKGVSAIEAMARIVLAVRAKRYPRTHAFLGGPSANVGVIDGGAKINIVPAECRIEIDRRTMPEETVEDLRAEIEELVAAAAGPAGYSIEVINQAAGYDLSENEPIVRLAVDAHEAVRGHPAHIAGMMGATDAAILIGAGVPAIVFGPGSLNEAHSTHEHVEVSELTDAARMYATIAAAFLAR